MSVLVHFRPLLLLLTLTTPANLLPAMPLRRDAS